MGRIDSDADGRRWGVTETELSEALRSLGMDRESGRALALLPLVQVAWADGAVQEAEQRLILELAQDRFSLDDEGRRMLRNWLTHRPTPAYSRRGQQVLVELCRFEGAEGDQQLRAVVDFAKDVAKAAGGYFGFGAVGVTEAEAIEAVAAALHISHERVWVTPDDTTLMHADADAQNDGPTPEIVFPEPSSRASRATLVHDDGLSGEQSIPIDAAGVTIGRGRDSTIQINYDAQVSRKHARVFERDGRFYVEDLGSVAGTWVNGERVVERRLLGGERVHVGAGAFFFQLSPAAAT
jgi:hypothetical protein